MSPYLSRLTLNAHHNRTKREFDWPYELHRTICNAWQDSKSARILFRPDQVRPGIVTVIVQSRTKPEWSRLDVPEDYLGEVDGPKKLDLQRVTVGQHLRFRLRCRPSKRIGAKDREDVGKRRGLTAKDEILGWLKRKGQAGGFEVHEVAFDRVYWYDSKGGIQDKPIGAVVFDGVLDVTEPETFRQAVDNGIGPQKAFGFGLLSLAPAEASP
jgi:CRISPR system Cascade subunit CasE